MYLDCPDIKRTFYIDPVMGTYFTLLHRFRIRIICLTTSKELDVVFYYESREQSWRVAL